MSLISGTLGIIVSLSGSGHPYWGVFFLLFSGLCDAFDGKVARTKKERTREEEAYGIQIDSLSDLIAFGALPVAIGAAMLRLLFTTEAPMLHFGEKLLENHRLIFFAILLIYMLCAMIRLAYFNVAEEKRRESEGGVRKFYEGLPVTSAALIFPTILLLQHSTYVDITILYFITMLITAVAFISRIKIPKPGLKGILIMVAIGAVEFAIHMFL